MSLPQTEYVQSLPMKHLTTPDTFYPTLGIGSLYKCGDQSVIEGFRFAPEYGECCRKKRGGFMQSPFCSKPSVLPGIKRERRLKTYKLPPVSDVDYKRRKEIEDFYETFQYHREQINDRFGVLHPLKYFMMEEYLYQDPPSITSIYLKFPHQHIGYRHPSLGLQDFRKKLDPLPMLPYKHLAGRTSKQKDTSWIR